MSSSNCQKFLTFVENNFNLMVGVYRYNKKKHKMRVFAAPAIEREEDFDDVPTIDILMMKGEGKFKLEKFEIANFSGKLKTSRHWFPDTNARNATCALTNYPT